ncbi:MAG TPA: CGNR zinc finger domain-containing protein [Micromonosporaceae bacterium]
MASVIVDGLAVPLPVSDHPAINFCNTRAGWGASRPKEYLLGYPQFAVWAREYDVLDAATCRALLAAGQADPAGAAGLVDRAVRFRSGLYAVLTRGATAADWTAVNAEVQRALATAELVPAPVTEAITTPTGQGAPPATWAVAGRELLDHPLLAVAWSAAQLLTSPVAASARACPGSGCGWLFLDPRGRRRWCSMAWCGNRAKVRRHAQRQRRELARPGHEPGPAGSQEPIV